MVDVLVVLLIISTLINIYFISKEQPLNEVMVSKETTSCVKGILSCFIILFHLAGYVQGGIVFTIIKDTGYLWTSMFFFMSGYGMLKKSITENGCASGFLKKRILSVLIPWILVTIVYVVYFLLIGKTQTILNRVNDVVNGFLIVKHSWFCIVVMLFYIVFYVAFKQTISINAKMRIVLLLTIIYIIIASYFGLGMWWYYSCLSFPLGIFISYYEKRLGLKTTAIIALIGLLLSYIGRYFNSKVLNDENFYVILHLIASAMFCALFYCCLRTFNIKHGIWNFIGKISYEVYLLHILVMDLLNYNGKNDVLYVILVFLVTISLAYIVNILVTKIKRFMYI